MDLCDINIVVEFKFRRRCFPYVCLSVSPALCLFVSLSVRIFKRNSYIMLYLRLMTSCPLNLGDDPYYDPDAGYAL